MNKAELAKWLKDKEFGAVILICPRCSKVDIVPNKHLNECDPAYEQYRFESQESSWK